MAAHVFLLGEGVVSCDGHGCGKHLSPGKDQIIIPNYFACEMCLVLKETELGFERFKIGSYKPGFYYSYCDFCMRTMEAYDYKYYPDFDLCADCYAGNNFTAPQGIVNFATLDMDAQAGVGPLRGYSTCELVDLYDSSDADLIKSCTKAGFMAGAGGAAVATSAHGVLASTAAASGGLLLPVTVPIHLALGVFGFFHATKSAKKGVKAGRAIEDIDSELSRRGFRVTSPSLRKRVKVAVKTLAGCVNRHEMEEMGVGVVEGILK